MKKVKLFTTIASLCLAVALMAFGVYAAQNTLTHTVAGNIQYQSTALAGEWTVTVTPVTTCTIDDAKTAKTFAAVTADEQTREENVRLAIDLNEEGAVFTVKAVFTASSSTAGTLAATFTNVTEDEYTIAYAILEDGKDLVIEETSGTATVTVQVTVTIIDQTTSISPAWSVAFAATAGTLE